MAPLDEGDAALGDETADVALADAEVAGDAGDVEKPREPSCFWVGSVESPMRIEESNPDIPFRNLTGSTQVLAVIRNCPAVASR